MVAGNNKIMHLLQTRGSLLASPELSTLCHTVILAALVPGFVRSPFLLSVYPVLLLPQTLSWPLNFQTSKDSKVNELQLLYVGYLQAGEGERIETNVTLWSELFQPKSACVRGVVSTQEFRG